MRGGPKDEYVGSCSGEITRRGRRPRYSGPLRAVLRTTDGVFLDACHTPAHQVVGEPEPSELALVVAHGFTGSLERPAVRRAVALFAQRVAVVTFSFRGHGRSSGRSTVGDREVLDLAAAVRWTRSLGYRTVATVGFSMGGSVVLRHAALHRQAGSLAPPEPAAAHDGRTEAHTDAAVAVSAPARWFYRGTAPMRRLHWAVEQPVGRLVSRAGLRTRIDHRSWDPIPLSPVAAAGLLSPVPLLVVHGDRDPYFPLDHPRSLAAAGDPLTTELWIEHGFGHAERAATPELLHRIARWASDAATGAVSGAVSGAVTTARTDPATPASTGADGTPS